MSIIRHALALAALSPVLFAGAVGSDKAEYAAGTVEAVPLNTQGVLDLGDPNELRFRYEEHSYGVPYSRITRSARSGPSGLVGKLKAVSALFARNRTQHLTIGFRDERGAEQAMTFAMSKAQVDKALPALQAKLPRPAPAPQSAWWGDRVWRTTRNASQWPQSQTATTATARKK